MYDYNNGKFSYHPPNNPEQETLNLPSLQLVDIFLH